jgi:DNA replication protein
MSSFKGFPNGKLHLTPIPATFFSELLPQIDDIVELKITLFAFWLLDHQEGDIRFLTEKFFSNDQIFMSGLGAEPQTELEKGLKKIVLRGTFIQVRDSVSGTNFYFLNSPRGRAGAKLAKEGKWQPGDIAPVSLEMERPNIFRLYEEHIGPLTPIMSDTLKDAENTYPPQWIVDAIRMAVHKNARNWRYVETILRSWKEKGRYETDRRDTQEGNRKYIEGEFADYIEH